MKPTQNMQINVPDIIKEKCNEFVENFCMESSVSLPEKLKHNNTWKETHDELAEVTDDILNTLYVVIIEIIYGLYRLSSNFFFSKG